MSDNSSLFSLEQLTRQAESSEMQTQEQEDSGLIDLEELSSHPTRPHARYRADSPPPLTTPLPRAMREESTLDGIAAVSVPRKRSGSLKWAGFAVGLCLFSLGLGYVMAEVASDTPASPASAPTVVVYTAVAPQDEPPAAGAADTDVEGAHETPASPEESELKDELNAVKTPTPTPKTRWTPKPKPETGSKPIAKPPKPEQPKPNSDPCAHCGGDLSCAMRCSVKHSK